MSNSQVGKVFEQVIRDVCDASLVDFEEGGVGSGAMDDLKAGWERRLTEVGVATFPWDPSPPPQPPQPAALAVPTTIPSNGPKPNIQSLTGSNASLPLATPPSTMPGAPRIKGELTSNISPPTLPPMNGLPAMSSQTAQQRAAIHLQQRYGAQANPQVERLQAGQRPQTMPMPPPGKQEPQNYAPAPVTQPQRPAVSNAQTDGAGDSLAEWKAEVARRRAAAAKAGAEPDRILMDQMRERARRMEGGGLMVPLDEYTPSMVGPQLKSFNQSSHSTDQAAPGAKKTTYQELIKAQYDGPGSDNDGEIADEDAINSDLDDPDEIIEGSENDEEGGTSSDIMLCTYDKVQRVKNKWKCTLKDGLMTTGGREYVFHKAQGEFEW